MRVRLILSLLILCLFYLLLAFFSAELVVRIAGAAVPAESPGWFWQVPDRTTGWSLIPNSAGRYYKPIYEYNIEMSVNSRGLRGPEKIGYEKSPGVYRVLVLGDSYVEASQVEFAESFPQRLGVLIQTQTGQPVQVINGGVIGWGNDQQLIWLQEEGYKYSPDLIVMSVYPRNDFMNNSEALEAANQGQILKPFFALEGNNLVRKYWPFDPATVPAVESKQAIVSPPEVKPGFLTPVGRLLYKYSALYRYIDPRLRAAVPHLAASLALTGLIEPGQETKEAAQPEDYLPLAYGVYRKEWDEDWQEAYRITATIFQEFQRTAVGMGAIPAAVVLTAAEDVYPEEWEEALNNYPALRAVETDIEGPHQRAAEALAQANVPALDLSNIIRERAFDGLMLHYPADGHYTPAGHELVAHALFNFLGEKGIVPFLTGHSVPLTVTAPARTPWDWFVLAVLLLLVGSIVWNVVKVGPMRWLRQAGTGLSTTVELLLYMARQRQFVLLPLLVVLLAFAGLLILAQASVVGPFIYTLI